MRIVLSYPALFLFLLLLGNISSAQEELIPLNIKKAYEKGTRSLDGSPGPNYWQNSSDYNIYADFNPASRELNGKEKIVYHNNSPDTLDRIVIRLYQNLNKGSSTRSFNLDPDLITGGMILTKLKLDNTDRDLSDTKKYATMGTLFIINIKDKPLLPNSDINIEIDWHFTLPSKENLRMGAYDSTSFLIGYWYPQVSVYDDIDGWDMIPYTGLQEFYNDFSSYNVEFTVPNNFAVWGTGVLQNPEEIFTNEYLKKYNSAFGSDSIIKIISKTDAGKQIFNSKNPANTWKFKAENVTDVVYGTSDHYLWDATSLEVEPGRRVYISAVYKDKSEDFYGVAKIARMCISYFSDLMPGVPFPFPSFTVFNGSGGMEFPMLINDGSTEVYRSTVGLTSHESAHQYFPFYIGTNEQKYAWMDEGWAVFLPTDLEQTHLNDRRRIEAAVIDFAASAGSETDIPLFVTSDNLTYKPYRLASYTRPGLSYFFLRDVLQDKKFKQALHLFIKEWHGKHPIPFDYFFTFNRAAGKNLSWFWKPWYFERDYPDLGIKNVVYSGQKLSVNIVKAGEVPVPVNLVILYSDGTKDSVYKSTSVWEKTDSLTIDLNLAKTVTKVELGASYIPDSNISNNSYEIERNKD